MSPEFFASVPVAVAAALVGAIATVTAALLAWLKDRNATAKRIQTLDEATKYLEFWRIAADTLATGTDSERAKATVPSVSARLRYAQRLVSERATFVPGQRAAHLSKTFGSFAQTLVYALPVLMFGFPLLALTKSVAGDNSRVLNVLTNGIGVVLAVIVITAIGIFIGGLWDFVTGKYKKDARG